MPTHGRARTMSNFNVKIRLRRTNGHGLYVQRYGPVQQRPSKGGDGSLELAFRFVPLSCMFVRISL